VAILPNLILRFAFLLPFYAAFPTLAEPDMDLTPDWQFVADTVMGGRSTGEVARVEIEGRDAARLTGEVSTANGGGFVQMAFDTGGLDATGFQAVAFEARGNGATYELRLRTGDLSRPWQSFRAPFEAPRDWTTVRIPLAALEAHRTDAPFDPAAIRRIGIFAVGREMRADVAVTGLRLER
jgi:hypothetical protein